MNIVQKLTLRHLKSHMKRSVLTVVAIIISVAMVTAVFTSAVTMINYFREVTIAVDGNYHSNIQVTDWNNNKNKFSSEKGLELFAPSALYGIVYSSENSFKQESTMMILATTQAFTELSAIDIAEGRFPKNDSEILLTRARLNESFPKSKLGDTITVKLSDGEDGSSTEKSFKIVGITDSVTSATDDYSSYTFASDDFLAKPGFLVDVRIRYAKMSSTIPKDVEKLAASMTGEVNYGLNNDLLVFSGVSANSDLILSIGIFAAILLVIIAVVSVFMIYDSFAVSYREREKYIGILTSVGATKRQRFSSVYFEAFILGLIGIPLGIGFGLGGIAITFKALQAPIASTLSVAYDGALHVYVNSFVIIGTVIASAVTLLISAYIPARKASKVSCIDAIKGNDVLKTVKAKKLRVSPLVGKMFGFPAVMAVKNFKRNKGRSRNIVFALFLSVTVFLAAANFSSLFTSLMNANLKDSADVEIHTSMDNKSKVDSVLAARNDISRVVVYSSMLVSCPDDYINPSGKDDIDFYPDIMLVFIDNASLDSYARQLSVDVDKLHSEIPGGILCNMSSYYIDNKNIIVNPIKTLKNETLPLSFYIGDEEDGKSVTTSVFVTKTATQYWAENAFPFNYSGCPALFVSLDYMNQVLKGEAQPMNNERLDYLLFSENESLSVELDEKIGALTTSYNLYSKGVELEAVSNLLTIAKVFAFGFIVLISLIAILNIIGAISNSLNERTREFAMLRAVGMTPAEFKKMIYFESFRYGFLALLFGIPLGIAIHYAEYSALSASFDFGFTINPALYLFAVLGVFAVIIISLLYCGDVLKNRDLIIETE